MNVNVCRVASLKEEPPCPVSNSCINVADLEDLDRVLHQAVRYRSRKDPRGLRQLRHRRPAAEAVLFAGMGEPGSSTTSGRGSRTSKLIGAE